MIVGNQVEVCIDLIVIAVFVRAFEGLQSRVDGVEYDLVLTDQVLDHQVQCVLTDGGVEDDLIVFQELLEAFNSAMP